MKKYHFSLLFSILSVITLVFLINSKAVASEFNFENKCDHPVRVAIHFMDLNGQWQQEGWWTVNPNVSTYLAAQNNTRLKSNNNIWYYYVETTDGSKIGWFGNQNVSFQGQMLKMLKAERVNANAVDFHWSINCPATPAPAQQAGMEGLLFWTGLLAFLYFVFFRRQSVITKIINWVFVAFLYALPILFVILGAYGNYEKEGIISGIITFVFGGFIGALVTIPWAALLSFITSKMEGAEYQKSVKEDERKRKEEQLEVERRQKEKQLEAERKQKQEDDKYHRIINCPICEGNGKAYIHEWHISRTPIDEDGGTSHYRLASKKLFDMYPNGWNDSCDGFKETNHYTYRACPYCKGDGIAYAWYGKIPACKIECDKCQGNGQITTKVKLEIGMGDKKITCSKCNGAGNCQVPEKSVIHVKTKSGGVYEDEREETVKDKCEEGDYIGDYPKRFILEITKDNKELLGKSKPRAS